MNHESFYSYIEIKADIFFFKNNNQSKLERGLKGLF